MHWKIFELHNAPDSLSSWDVIQAGYEPVDFTSGSFTALPINDLLAGAIQQDSQLRYDALRAGAAVPKPSKPPTTTNTDQQLPKERIPAEDHKIHSNLQSPTTTVPSPPSIHKNPAPSQQQPVTTVINDPLPPSRPPQQEQQQPPVVDAAMMDFDIVIEAADNPHTHQHITYKDDDDVINHDFYTTTTQMSPTQPDQPPPKFITTTTMAPPPPPPPPLIPPEVVPRQPHMAPAPLQVPQPPSLSSSLPATRNWATSTTTANDNQPATAVTRKTGQFRLPRPAPSAAQGSRGAQLKELLEQKPELLLIEQQDTVTDAEKVERLRRLKEAIWADFNGGNVEGAAVTEVKQKPPAVAAQQQPFHAQEQPYQQQQQQHRQLPPPPPYQQQQVQRHHIVAASPLPPFPPSLPPVQESGEEFSASLVAQIDALEAAHVQKKHNLAIGGNRFGMLEQQQAPLPPPELELQGHAVFATGRGNALKVSDEALQKARSIMREEENSGGVGGEIGDKLNPIAANPKENRNSNNGNNNDDQYAGKQQQQQQQVVCFTTGTGAPCALSESAIKRARAIFGDDNDDDDDDDDDEASTRKKVRRAHEEEIIMTVESIAALPPVGGREGEEFGFKTGSGAACAVSANALKIAKAIFKDDGEPSPMNDGGGTIIDGISNNTTDAADAAKVPVFKMPQQQSTTPRTAGENNNNNTPDLRRQVLKSRLHQLPGINRTTPGSSGSGSGEERSAGPSRFNGDGSAAVPVSAGGGGVSRKFTTPRSVAPPLRQHQQQRQQQQQQRQQGENTASKMEPVHPLTTSVLKQLLASVPTVGGGGEVGQLYLKYLDSVEAKYALVADMMSYGSDNNIITVETATPFIGWKQIYQQLISTTTTKQEEGVDPKPNSRPLINTKYATTSWVQNHYRWIVYKIARLTLQLLLVTNQEEDNEAVAAPFLLRSDIVLDELKYRYEREFNRGHRSILKGILQHNISPATPMVLMVASVEVLGGGGGNETLQLELTDGWYGVKAIFDHGRSSAHQLAIDPGMKLRICGAELSSPGPADDDTVGAAACAGTMLKITMNGARPVDPFSKLGRVHPAAIQAGIYLPLSSAVIRGNGNVGGGGFIPQTMVVIQRIFPQLTLASMPSGARVLMTQRTLAAVEKRAEKGVSEAVLQAKMQVKKEEQEMCDGWLKHGKQGSGGMSREDRLYATMMTGRTGGNRSLNKHASSAAAAIWDGSGDIIDSSVLEAYFSDLNGPDSRALISYIEKKKGDLENKMREALRPLLRNVGDRPLFAHPVVTVLVQEVKPKKKKKKEGGGGDASHPPRSEQQQEQQLEEALITISRPSEELMESLREGGVYSVTWLSPDSSGSGGGYSPGGDGDGAGGRLATWTHLTTTSGGAGGGGGRGGGGKMSMWRSIKKKVEDISSSSSLLQCAFTPRQKLDLATMLNMAMAIEQPNDDDNGNNNNKCLLKAKLFDYNGMLVHAGPRYPDPNCPGHFMQWLFLTDTSLLGGDGDDHCDGWMLAVKLQGPDDAIDWLDDDSYGSKGLMRVILKDIVLGGVDEGNKVWRAYGDQLSGVVVVSRVGKEEGGWMGERMEVMRGKAATLAESKK